MSSFKLICNFKKNLYLILKMIWFLITADFFPQNLCTDDEYRLENITYSLDYRPIDGDVSREQNALATANFKPHGEQIKTNIFLLEC